MWSISCLKMSLVSADLILRMPSLERYACPGFADHAIMWMWGWPPSSWKAAYQRKLARLIVKSPYISGSGVGGYLEYIGTREGVELLRAGYME